MNRQNVAELAFKILGAYFLVRGLIGLPEAVLAPIYYKSMPGGYHIPLGQMILAYLLPMCLELSLGICLWVFSARFAEKMFGEHSEVPAQSRASIQQWLSSTLVVLGAYFAVVGIVGVVTALIYNYGANIQFMGPGAGTLGRLMGRVRPGSTVPMTAIMEAIIGVALLSSANSLVAWLYQPRAIADQGEE